MIRKLETLPPPYLKKGFLHRMHLNHKFLPKYNNSECCQLRWGLGLLVSGSFSLQRYTYTEWPVGQRVVSNYVLVSPHSMYDSFLSWPVRLFRG